MNMKTGLNQGNIREDNLILALEHLKKQPLSGSDLSRMMDLSKPALSKIITDLIDLGLIKENGYEQIGESKKGRKKLLYEINTKLGLISSVVFHSTSAEVIIYDLQLNKIDSRSLEDCEFLTIENLITIRGYIEEIIKEKNMRLLGICFAVPGKVYKDKNEISISPKLEKVKDISFKEFFGNYFNCLITMKNDINLYMIAEKEHGSLIDKENCALLYIDSGIGGALVLNDKIFEGQHGFAGEFGLIKYYNSDGEVNYLDAISSTNSIKQKIYDYQNINNVNLLGEKFKLKDVIHLYNEGNEIVQKIVFSSTNQIAQLISNIYNLLDCSEIRICGRIKFFGEKYLEEIRRRLGKESQNINIQFASLNEDAEGIGAAEACITNFFDKWISNRKRIKDEKI